MENAFEARHDDNNVVSSGAVEDEDTVSLVEEIQTAAQQAVDDVAAASRRSNDEASSSNNDGLTVDDGYVIDTEPLPHSLRPHTPPLHDGRRPSASPSSSRMEELQATPPSGQGYLSLVRAESTDSAHLAASLSAEASAAYYEQQQQEQQQQQQQQQHHHRPHSHYHHMHVFSNPDPFGIVAAELASSSSSSPASSTGRPTVIMADNAVVAASPSPSAVLPSVWTAGTVNGVCPPGEKPKRPLSAYNFFFQLERERIVESNGSGTLGENDTKVYTLEDVARVALLQQQKLADPQPKEKRSHRKTHGKISFGDLARTIAVRWKRLDDQSKAIFDGSASLEKERYRRELAEWTKQQKKWKEAAAKLTNSMRHQHLFGSSATATAGASTTSFPPPLRNVVTTNSYQSGSDNTMHNGDDDCVVVTPSKSPRASVGNKASSSHLSPAAAAQARRDAIATAMLNQQCMVKDSPHSASSSGSNIMRSRQSLPVFPDASQLAERRPSSMAHYVQQHQQQHQHGHGHHHLQRRSHHASSAEAMDRRYSTGMMMPARQPSSVVASGYRSMTYQQQLQQQQQQQQHLPYINLDEDHMMDYDDLADETYSKAHMMLPEQQQQLRPSNAAYQAMLNQRRMRMFTMMQQRQQMTMAAAMNNGSMAMKQQQAIMQQQQMLNMMRRMNQTQNGGGGSSPSSNNDMDMASFGGLEQSIHHQEQQRQALMDQMAELSGGTGIMDDVAAYMDHSSAAASMGQADYGFDNDLESSPMGHGTLSPPRFAHQQQHHKPSSSSPGDDSYHQLLREAESAFE